ncbi:BcepGomrgp36 [Burkholderia phage BcepGomr]|uniref:BcepGomrgp36 n=1 Tax=Burkholderia phage BcepGomr TaxID=437329 RepID=UPI00015034F5|nr:BcepGomrgp36 [Burkholderia phage BcepGomr]ABP63607.1 BcepGomrgp36 [Burkholderia phage BcepGomr]
MLASAIPKSHVELVLVMDSTEAQWLKAMMQNGLENEPPAVTEVRQAIFNALAGAGV